MKNKTILKAVKIGFCALIILTACIIPTFAEEPNTTEYNGYISIGEYAFNTLPSNSFSIEPYNDDGDFIFFISYSGTEYNVLSYSVGSDYISLYSDIDGSEVYISLGALCEVIVEVDVSEEQYNAFMQCFTPVVEESTPDPEPVPPTNIYQTCYDLINTYVFGGTVVANTYQDLICIAFSATACIFLMCLPFLLVWIIIKVWF